MKSQHFCTEELVEDLTDPRIRIITTYRTGWTPSYKIGEFVKLNKRDKKGNDTLQCYGKVLKCAPLQYQHLPPKGKREVERYNKNFHEEHWFFEEKFQKIYNLTKSERSPRSSGRG